LTPSSGLTPSLPKSGAAAADDDEISPTRPRPHVVVVAAAATPHDTSATSASAAIQTLRDAPRGVSRASGRSRRGEPSSAEESAPDRVTDDMAGRSELGRAAIDLHRGERARAAQTVLESARVRASDNAGGRRAGFDSFGSSRIAARSVDARANVNESFVRAFATFRSSFSHAVTPARGGCLTDSLPGEPPCLIAGQQQQALSSSSRAH